MIALLLDPASQPCDAGPGPGMGSMRGRLLASLPVDPDGESPQFSSVVY